MNAQDLKNSILQLAIQGKLVKQREEEGTAKELLKTIQTEKKQMIKEGKIKKQKELPEIEEDEIPFDIPESWRWVRINDVIQIINGDRGKNYPSKDKLTVRGIPFISALNIENNSISEEKLLYMNEGQYQKLGSGKLMKGDLVLCIRGSLGKSGRYPFDKGAIASSLVILRSYLNENYFYEYISWYINSGLFSKEVRKYNNGTAQPNLGARDLAKFIVPLPPLEEQKRIIAKIEELIPYVDKYDAAYSEVENLNKKFPKDMQKSVLQYAIQGKLVEQREEDGTAEDLYKQIQDEKKKLIKEGKIKKTKELSEITEDEIPFDIPDNWKWVRLGDITHDWGQKKPNEIFDYIDVGSIDNINGRLSKEENLTKPKDAPSRARKIVKEGSVLYATVRPYLLNICIIDKEFKHEPIASTAFAILHPIKGIYNKYLFFILKSPMFISYVSSMMIGVAYPAINDTNLMYGLIPLPPFAEQKRIVEKIEELLHYTKQLII